MGLSKAGYKGVGLIGVGAGKLPRFAPIGMHKTIYTVGPTPFHFIHRAPVYRHDYCPLGCATFMRLEKIDFNVNEFYEQLMSECLR